MSEDPGKIVKTVREMLTTYDVTDKHLCINERGNKISEVFKEVEAKLKEQHPELYEDMDYFNVFSRDGEEPWPTLNDWLKVFYVEGGSEGWYVHVEAGGRLILLGKTLREGEAGISWAERMVCALSRIFYQPKPGVIVKARYMTKPA